eukprot:m.450311 g.450311  ORF g.450311 m.450311 type:complete len:117 (+) comp20320_c4_seq14:967-1317(+)
MLRRNANVSVSDCHDIIAIATAIAMASTVTITTTITTTATCGPRGVVSRPLTAAPQYQHQHQHPPSQHRQRCLRRWSRVVLRRLDLVLACLGRWLAWGAVRRSRPCCDSFSTAGRK